MHICAHEIIALALLANLVQGLGHIWLWHKVTEARVIAHKFKERLLARPTQTIVYGSKR